MARGASLHPRRVSGKACSAKYLPCGAWLTEALGTLQIPPCWRSLKPVPNHQPLRKVDLPYQTQRPLPDTKAFQESSWPAGP